MRAVSKGADSKGADEGSAISVPFFMSEAPVKNSFRSESVDIEFNNFNTLDAQDTGWFLHSSEWAREKKPESPELLYMPKGMLPYAMHAVDAWLKRWRAWRAQAKKRREGDIHHRSIIVSKTGCFRLRFFSQEHFPGEGRPQINKHDRFFAWGLDICHRWFMDEDGPF